MAMNKRAARTSASVKAAVWRAGGSLALPGGWRLLFCVPNFLGQMVAGFREAKIRAVTSGQTQHLRTGIADRTIREKTNGRQTRVRELHLRDAKGRGMAEVTAGGIGGEVSRTIYDCDLETAIKRIIDSLGVF